VLHGRVGVLLDEERGSSLPVDLLDRLEDRVDEDRSEAEGGLVQEQDLRARYQGSADRKHLLPPTTA